MKCLLTILATLLFSYSAHAADKPNIVFFFLDDWGWQDAGFMGSTYYDTPVMDVLAAEGLRFDSAYSAAANCAPTRAALLSGQYAPRTGIYTVADAERGNSEERRLIPTTNTLFLGNDVVTMAESIKAAGYNTGHIGKWHLGTGEEGGPLVQGYDLNIGGNHLGLQEGGHFAPYNDTSTITQGPDGEYLTDRLTDEAISFINDQSVDKPFYLMLSHYAVHTPIEAPEITTEKYKNRTADAYHNNPVYGAMIDHVDQGIGRILQVLKNKGFDDNTVIILTSDNGGYGPTTQAPDLRGAKGTPYEGGNRVPMVIKMPGGFGAGEFNNTPVNSVDFYPTLVELAGGEMPQNQFADGESLMPILKGNEIERDALFYHFPAYLEPYADTTTWRAKPFGSVSMRRYKLIEFFEFGQLELYDLETDLKETTNIALDKPEITAKLYKRMLEWRTETNAPIPTELNAEYDVKYTPKDYVTWEQVQEKLAH